ncbi:MAG TPA: Type 1 glutamine amidotransferase-like domain-containing protein [Candidatus Pristimantibacillus sp.]|nr:Type 1 glutamine amidotransferase-like domain-containing protein [Candidatus Pristimantibacillus sp.]
MKLLLTSSGLHNKSLQSALAGMLDKPVSECNFLFIPTSYHGAVSDMTWLVEDFYNAHSMGWKQFMVLDIAVKSSWDKELWWPMIEQADVIQMGGGNAQYLSYWLQKSGLFDALPEPLKTKVYVGVSAGSMVLTAGLTSANIGQSENYEIDLNDPRLPAGQASDKTLGLTDFLFRPHWHKPGPKYENLTEETVRKAYEVLKKPIYLVDDETGIKIVDGQLEVISEGQWVLVDSE